MNDGGKLDRAVCLLFADFATTCGSPQRTSSVVPSMQNAVASTDGHWTNLIGQANKSRIVVWIRGWAGVVLFLEMRQVFFHEQTAIGHERRLQFMTGN